MATSVHARVNPKGKSRIAGSIGNVISKQLLDSKTLSDVLSSDEMTAKIRLAIENFVAKNEENTHTLYYALTQYVQEDTLRAAHENVRNDISDFAYEKITETNFVKNFAEEMLYWVRDAIFFVRIPLLDRLVGDKIAKSIIEPIFVSECCKMLRTALVLGLTEEEFNSYIDAISSDFKNDSLDKKVLWSKMLRIISEIKNDVLTPEIYTVYQKQLAEIAENPYSKLTKYLAQYDISDSELCKGADIFELFYNRSLYSDKIKLSNMVNDNEEVTADSKRIIKISKCGKKLYVPDNLTEKQTEILADCIIYNVFYDNPGVLNKYFNVNDLTK